MMRMITILHILLLVGWLSAAMIYALGVATMGNEETVLSRERGSGLSQRRALIERQDVLRSQLQAEARRDRLEVAVRRLDLPLEAPERRSTPPSALEVARRDGEAARP